MTVLLARWQRNEDGIEMEARQLAGEMFNQEIMSDGQ